MSQRISTVSELNTFKNKYCNENNLIAKKLKGLFDIKLMEPILDIGCGLCDIASNAFADKKVICIDKVKISRNDTNLPSNHELLHQDFFDFNPRTNIGTFFISHSQQYLDDDISALFEKTEQLNPKHIIIVENDNDGLLGHIIKKIKELQLKTNIEEKIIGYPNGYSEVRAVHFSAELRCETYQQLADQISYMILLEGSPSTVLLDLLKSVLTHPRLSFNQTLRVYEKNRG